MQKNALGEKNHQAGKQPLRHFFRKEQPGQAAGKKGRGHAESYVYQTGCNKQHVKAFRKYTDSAQQVSIQYVGKHWLKGI